MEFIEPITVDMEEFIKYGKFDFIQIGQTKEWILNNFPNPDGNYSMSYKDNIWCYGSFEFMFVKNYLTSIFCETLPLKARRSLLIKEWVINKPITLLNIIEILIRENTGFQLNHTNGVFAESVLTILDSHVVLRFFDEENRIKNRNDYLLRNFGLSEKKS